MKLTNKQVYESWPYLNALGSVNLPPKVGFRIGRIVRKIKDVVIDIEAEQAKLVEKYGEKDVDGKLKTFDSNGVESTKLTDQQAFKTERDELLAESTDVDVQLIWVKDLGDIPLAANMFAALDWLIVE